MPPCGQVSSCARSSWAGEYAPTDEATTRWGTPAAATARATWAVPATLTRHSRARSEFGWMSQARWTTASTPANARVSCATAVSGSVAAPMSIEVHAHPL